MAQPSNAIVPPPPNGQILSLVSALSNPENHQLHVQAIQVRDAALAGDSYGDLCLQLAFLLLICDHHPPTEILSKLSPADLEAWKQTDAASVAHLQHNPQHWVQFGQTAGFILKNALTRPPFVQNSTRLAAIPSGAEQLQSCLLLALSCQHPELRAVASSIVATCAVSYDGVQPALHVSSWSTLVPQLLGPLQNPQPQLLSQFQGALETVKKIMEDGPSELETEHLDGIVDALMKLLHNNSTTQYLDDASKAAILQSLLAACNIVEPGGSFQSAALVLHVEQYLHSLLALVNDANAVVRHAACRNLVTLLGVRSDLFSKDVFKAVSLAMLARTSDANRIVALEACEFWLTFTSLEIHDHPRGAEMRQEVQSLFSQLLVTLLNNMVYGPDEQAEFVEKNTMELAGNHRDTMNVKPVFHRSRAQHANIQGDDEASSDEDLDDDDDDDDDNEDEDGGNAWTLRKCSAATLDAFASLFGAEALLPILWPSLEQGLSSTEGNKEWVQEACILALGAIAEGCHLELGAPQYMGRLHPFLLNNLTPGTLPQLQSITAWTLGRYAGWAVEQVQTGTQGHLLAQMTQVMLELLVQTPHPSVQVATCSGFGVVVEAAGDLLVPYLEPIFEHFVLALQRFYNHSSRKPVFLRSLLMLFDAFGIIADCCGPAIAEGRLPSIYLPPLLQTWDMVASSALSDPKANTLLLPLMEALASIAVTLGTNFQPYAMRSFDNAMCIIEMTTLSVSTLDASDDDQPLFGNEEDYDPIICAADLLDGMVEGLGPSFHELVNSSHKYGPQFLSLVHSLCRHEIGGVRMSGLALLGDLARNTPAMLEPGLQQLLQEAVLSANPQSQAASVCTNAIWATGEIVVRCQGNPRLLDQVVEPLIQNILALLAEHASGLAENAASCAGRLATVTPEPVAAQLERLLLAGWCEAMGKIADPGERRDAYQGFLDVIYLNPKAIHNVHGQEVSHVLVKIVKCIMTWHLPSHLGVEETTEVSEQQFRPFPPTEAKLGEALAQLMRDMKSSVSEEDWGLVQRSLPVSARKLLRDGYQL